MLLALYSLFWGPSPITAQLIATAQNASFAANGGPIAGASLIEAADNAAFSANAIVSSSASLNLMTANAGFVATGGPIVAASLSEAAAAAALAASAGTVIHAALNLTAQGALHNLTGGPIVRAALSRTAANATLASIAGSLRFATLNKTAQPATLLAADTVLIEARLSATSTATLSTSGGPRIVASLIGTSSASINAIGKTMITARLSESATPAAIVASGTGIVRAYLNAVADQAAITASGTVTTPPLTLRELVFRALFTRMQTVPGIAVSTRRFTLPAMVPPGDLPCLMQWEQPEIARNQTGLPDKRLWEAWIVIVFTNPDTTVSGSTIINPILDAIEKALTIDDIGRNLCTLGGLVHYARIEGTVIKETGDTDTTGLGGAVVPIRIMPP
jgi:hypothetical protein